MKKSDSPSAQLDRFIDRYTPEIATQARACLKKMRARLPGATQLVYDNYYALVIGFGPSEKASHAIFSVALYPKWINLFFLQGAGLPDPHGLLRGEGSIVRSIRLASPADLDRPEIEELIATALEHAIAPIDPKGKGSLTIRAIAPKQRPRVPIKKT